jgi:hypothetical protein
MMNAELIARLTEAVTAAVRVVMEYAAAPAAPAGPVGNVWFLSQAGVMLFAELRRERRTTLQEQCVVLRCADSVVFLPWALAHILSPVLRSVVSGPLAQEFKREYSLREHSAATVEFAIDYCCGDPAKWIGLENALALLALADELCLEPLRTACSEALVESLVSTNAAQLQEAAERYNAPVLLAAARSITAAESNALGDLIARKLGLQSRLERSTQLQTAEGREGQRERAPQEDPGGRKPALPRD